jgi:UDP-3-O-[3-hydroxymyristoyl] glucosamine N-acyltransferase
MFKITDIFEKIQGIQIVNLSSELVSKVLQIDDKSFDKNSIAWCSDKNIEFLNSIELGTVIISQNAFAEKNFKINEKVCILVVENARKSFSKMLNSFFVEKDIFGQMGDNVHIHSSVNVDFDSVIFGNNVTIEKNCEIGKNVIIDHNSVIKSGTIIFDNVKIGANCTIGGVGFGYEQNESGQYEVIPHIGNVVLKNNVEIGNNVCIDRAVLGSTILHEHVKVDNLVHIAHGVEIGKNSLIIANAMIAGSVKIGENCWIAPSASIKQKLTIGDDSIVGLGSVVLRNVDEKSTVAGVPAKKLN